MAKNTDAGGGAPPAPSPPPQGHNGSAGKGKLDRNQRAKLRLSHISKMRPLRSEIEKLQSAMRAVRKELNQIRDEYANDGFSLAALDERFKNEGKPRKVVQAYENERYELGEDLGQANYQQPDLFASMPETAREEEYWGDIGYQLGIEGKECKAPSDMPTQFLQAFTKRWHGAQEKLAWAMAPDANPEKGQNQNDHNPGDPLLQ